MKISKGMKKTQKGTVSFSKAEIAGAFLGNCGHVIGESRKLSEVEAGNTSFNVKKGGSNQVQSFASALRTETIPPSIQMSPETTYLVPFRLVSAAIIGAGSWKATDFSQNNVLRMAMNLLMGKPVYKNHGLWDVDNWLGVVNEISWTESYVQDGVTVPAGIDGVLAIDIQTDDRKSIATGIATGAIRSNSVTVEFEWVPSHEFESEYTFWELLGTMVDGRMVCRVVTRIIDFHETSIVGLGADPFAKKIMVNGNLIDIDMAGAEKALQTPQMPFSKFAKEATAEQLASFSRSVSAFAVDTRKENVVAYGSTFSDFCKTKINEYCDAHGISFNEVVKRMATASKTSEKTVNRYINGQLNCPKPYYIQEWSKVLLCQPKDMIAACSGDGCSYGDAEMEAMLAGNALECPEKPEEGEPEDMAAELSKQVELMNNITKSLQAQLDAMKKGNSGEAEKALKLQLEAMQNELNVSKEAYQNTLKSHALELSKLRTELNVEKEKALQLQAEKTALEMNASTLENIMTEKVALQAQIESQGIELSALREREAFAKIGEEYLQTMQAEAIRMYRASVGEKASEEVENLLKKANTFEAVNGILVQYGQQLASQFQFKCVDCGSGNCTFGSVSGSDKGKKETKTYNAGGELNTEEMRAKYQKSKI